MATTQHLPLELPSSWRAFAVALSSTVALLAAGSDALARERSTTLTGPKGKTAQHEAERAKGDVSGSTTGPTGKSTSHSVDRNAGGTTAEATGPNGKTATRSTTRTRNGKQTTVTGSDGKTATRSTTREP